MGLLSTEKLAGEWSDVKILDTAIGSAQASTNLEKDESLSKRFTVFSTNFTLIAGGRLISNHLDPTGATVKRGFFHRFITVTLPENGPIALRFWLGRIKKFEPGMVLAIPVLVIGTAKIFEITRWTCASIIHLFPHPEAKELATIVGPRDFYASRSEGTGENNPQARDPTFNRSNDGSPTDSVRSVP